jgi:hypothetical protein
MWGSLRKPLSIDEAVEYPTLYGTIDGPFFFIISIDKYILKRSCRYI